MPPSGLNENFKFLRNDVIMTDSDRFLRLNYNHYRTTCHLNKGFQYFIQNSYTRCPNMVTKISKFWPTGEPNYLNNSLLSFVLLILLKIKISIFSVQICQNSKVDTTVFFQMNKIFPSVTNLASVAHDDVTEDFSNITYLIHHNWFLK